MTDRADRAGGAAGTDGTDGTYRTDGSTPPHTEAHAFVSPLRERPRALALLIALFISSAYFVGAPAWNQNSRFALTQALVEEGTAAIDRFAATTGDKSFRAGHYYSDKAPGVSLAAAPPYAVVSALRTATGGAAPAIRVVPLDPVDLATGRAPAPEARKPGDRLRYNPAFRVGMYVARVGSIGLLSALGLAAFFLIALRLAEARRGGVPSRSPARATTLALAATAIYGLATPAFVYATALYGHRPAADALIAAVAMVWLHPDPRRASGGLGVALGTALGWAVLFEYTAAVPVAVVCAWAAVRLSGRATMAMLGSGATWAAVLAAYHIWVFGGPLQTGYDFLVEAEFAEGMAVRYGLGPPDLGVALQLLFGSYRGLFFVSPVLLLAAWGLWLVESRTLRRLAWFVILYYVLLVSGYYMWDGGAATGPRHALPAIPFLALGLVEAAARIPRATAALAAISAVAMLAAADAGPESPQHGVAIWEHAFSQIGRIGTPGTATASNLGRFAGLPGPVSLVPLFAAWLALYVFATADETGRGDPANRSKRTV